MADIVPVDDRVMIDWSDFELTDAGLEMRQKAIGEKKVIDFGYAMIGQGRPESSQAVYTMEALVIPAAKVAVHRSVGRETTHYLDILIDNKEIEEDIYCTEIGVFARFTEAEEYRLYGYSYALTGYEQVPPGSVFHRKYHIGANTHISRSCSITVSYDDSFIYVPFDDFVLTQPTEFVATITHEFEYDPMFCLELSRCGFATRPFGQGSFGGRPTESLPMRHERLSGRRVNIYTVPGFEGEPRIERHSKYQLAFLYPDNTKNLILKMR